MCVCMCFERKRGTQCCIFSETFASPSTTINVYLRTLDEYPGNRKCRPPCHTAHYFYYHQCHRLLQGNIQIQVPGTITRENKKIMSSERPSSLRISIFTRNITYICLPHFSDSCAVFLEVSIESLNHVALQYCLADGLTFLEWGGSTVCSHLTDALHHGDVSEPDVSLLCTITHGHFASLPLMGPWCLNKIQCIWWQRGPGTPSLTSCTLAASTFIIHALCVPPPSLSSWIIETTMAVMFWEESIYGHARFDVMQSCPSSYEIRWRSLTTTNLTPQKKFFLRVGNMVTHYFITVKRHFDFFAFCLWAEGWFVCFSFCLCESLFVSLFFQIFRFSLERRSGNLVRISCNFIVVLTNGCNDTGAWSSIGGKTDEKFAVTSSRYLILKFRLSFSYNSKSSQGSVSIMESSFLEYWCLWSEGFHCFLSICTDHAAHC